MLDTDQRIRDLSAVLDDISGPGLQPETLKKIRALDIETLPVVSAAPRIGPCVGAVDLDHCRETGQEVIPCPFLSCRKNG